MSFEELLVFFVLLKMFWCQVERNLDGFARCERLLRFQLGEEGVSKEIQMWCVIGGAVTYLSVGRAPPKQTEQHRDYDDTKGYPGEDIRQ